MKAIVRDTYGSADVLRLDDLPVPEVGADDVLVRVEHAAIDRGAWHLMEGKPYAMRLAGFGMRRPKNRGLGSELAGVVTAVGADVTEFEPGDEVFGTSRTAFAEFSISKVARLARKPASMSFEQAAALPISGGTALQAVRDRARVHAGQHVLVIGAAGGVGSYASQIARSLGARVTGVASTAKLELVRALGAENVIDYTASDIEEFQPYDVVLDMAGNRPLAQLRKVLTPTGTLVIVGGEDGGPLTGGLDRQFRAKFLSLFVKQRLDFLVSKERAADFTALAEMVERGEITPKIDRIVALADVPTAIADLAAGRVGGKVVVTVRQASTGARAT
jgi:NADPH:quinone reductase-like Zn-dependent oxidoreductase